MFFQIKAKLIDIPRRMYYNACPDEFCSKKMDLVPGTKNIWYCPKCEKYQDYSQVKYMGSVKLADDTFTMYATVCNDTIGDTIFGINAREYKEKVALLDDTRFSEMTEKIKNSDYKFNIMAGYHCYEGKESVKFTIINAELIEFEQSKNPEIKPIQILQGIKNEFKKRLSLMMS
jgi:Replication factor-A C terminal domain